MQENKNQPCNRTMLDMEHILRSYFDILSKRAPEDGYSEYPPSANHLIHAQAHISRRRRASFLHSLDPLAVAMLYGWVSFRLFLRSKKETKTVHRELRPHGCISLQAKSPNNGVAPRLAAMEMYG